jgi:hypothetical protein
VSFSSWASANRGTVLTLGAAAAAVVALGYRSYAQAVIVQNQKSLKNKRGIPSHERGEGFLLCPSDFHVVPGNTDGLIAGDFVIIELSAKDRTFHEMTWAQVLSISPDGFDLYVKIAGEYLEAGVRPLNTEKHGYHVGDRMIIPRDCVFDMLHVHSQLEGIIACGPELSVFTGETGDPLYTPKDASGVAQSDLVQVVIADGVTAAWSEPLWVLVSKVSPTEQVLTGIITEVPQFEDRHKLKQYSKVSFNRDCIVDIKYTFA